MNDCSNILKRIRARIHTVPKIDKTLTKAGMCEDAKATGEAIAEATLNGAYPIGTIYMTVNGTSQSEFFNGKWEKLENNTGILVANVWKRVL